MHQLTGNKQYVEIKRYLNVCYTVHIKTDKQVLTRINQLKKIFQLHIEILKTTNYHGENM